MAEHTNDGGSAFPYDFNELRNQSNGMTLRDWFAGQVIGHLAVREDSTIMGDVIAAYNYADLMLVERAKGSSVGDRERDLKTLADLNASLEVQS
jgi:hypothetical protein